MSEASKGLNDTISQEVSAVAPRPNKFKNGSHTRNRLAELRSKYSAKSLNSSQDIHFTINVVDKRVIRDSSDEVS